MLMKDTHLDTADRSYGCYVNVTVKAQKQVRVIRDHVRIIVDGVPLSKSPTPVLRRTTPIEVIGTIRSNFILRAEVLWKTSLAVTRRGII